MAVEVLQPVSLPADILAKKPVRAEFGLCSTMCVCVSLQGQGLGARTSETVEADALAVEVP